MTALPDWLSILPADWEVKPFYCAFRERVQLNTGLKEARVLSLSYGRVVERDVESNSGLLPESFEGYNIVEPDDVVMRLTDLQNDQRSLRTGRVTERGVITSAYVTVVPGTDLSPRFAHYLLHGYDLAKVFYRMGGGLRQTMKFSDLKRMPVVVPPRTVQDRIANFLDEQTARIDALIAEKEKLRRAVDEFARAEVSRLLTEGKRGARLVRTGRHVLPSAPEGWRVAAFKRALIGMEQGWSPQCENRPADEGEWGVLKVGCVNGVRFDANENKALPLELQPDLTCVIKRGDVLVSRANTRELVGMAALVEEEHPNLLLCDKLYRLILRPDWVVAAYAVLLLRSEAARRQIELGASGASASMQNISQDVLKELVAAFPPVQEQEELVRRAREVEGRTERMVQHVHEHIARLREYRSSLISAAVTGQLDVSAYRLPAAEELATA